MSTNPNPGFTLPIWQPFHTTSLGDCIVLPGYSDTPTIQVLGIYMQCGATTNLIIKAGSTALTGTMCFVAGGSMQLVNQENPYYQCYNGDDLIFNLAGLTGSCGGAIFYVQF